MFGQPRSLLEHGFIWFPFVVIPVVVPLLSYSPLSLVDIFVLFLGASLLIFAKWPLLQQGHYTTFGIGPIEGKRRLAYVFAYVLLVTGLIGAIALHISAEYFL